MKRTRRKNHDKLIKVEGFTPDERMDALEIVTRLEDVQGYIDDTVELLNRQNEALEAVITKVIRGGVRLG